MPGIAQCMEDPMVELTPVIGGYIATVRVPPSTDEDDDYGEIKPIISADLDLILAQIKRHIIETQHTWRKANWGEIPSEKEKPVKKSTRKQ